MASWIACMPAIVSRTCVCPRSALATTASDNREASAAATSTSRSEEAISSIDALVSSAAPASVSAFSRTWRTLTTSWSIEPETSSTRR